MGILSKFFHSETSTYQDSDIVAIANAEMIPASKINDVMFQQEMMGQTIGFQLADDTIVAPCNGVLEVLFPTGHAFAVRANNGMGILVHIGIDTVQLNGKGFKVLAKQNDQVHAGQPIVKVNTSLIREAGFDPTSMLVITEPLHENEKVELIQFGPVKKGQVINQK